MPIELVTGQGSDAHISSSDVGALIAALVGTGVYAFPTAAPGLTLTGSNTVSISAGHLVACGRHVRFSGTETVTFDSGVSGYNRLDLMCLAYSIDKNTGIETIDLTVLKGTPTTGTPTNTKADDPSRMLGDPSSLNMAFAQIKFSGVTPTVALTAPAIPTLTALSSSLMQYTNSLSSTITNNANSLSSRITNNVNSLSSRITTAQNTANNAQNTANSATTKANNAQNTANRANSRIDKAVPAYRVFNQNSGDHFWTTDKSEYDSVKKWAKGEGIAGYLFRTKP